MLIDQLCRIPEFRDIPPSELRALAEATQVLCIPENRWLVQPGRDVPGYFYLLKGEIQTTNPTRIVRGDSRALEHFYPGCAAARTATACQVLRIEPRRREFLLNTGAGLGKTGQAPAWLERFLTSTMMEQLQPAVWRQVLRAFEPVELGPNRPVVSYGSLASHCFVLEEGHAVVHRGPVTLCHLSPGDFFGEDALIVGGRRNADITTLEPSRLQSIGIVAFQQLLLERLVQFVHCERRFNGMRLNVGSGPIPNALPVSLARMREQLTDFDPRLDYLVVGGRRGDRALVAFLLRQRGIRAAALEDGPDASPAG